MVKHVVSLLVLWGALAGPWASFHFATCKRFESIFPMGIANSAGWVVGVGGPPVSSSTLAPSLTPGSLASPLLRIAAPHSSDLLKGGLVGRSVETEVSVDHRHGCVGWGGARAAGLQGGVGRVGDVEGVLQVAIGQTMV